MDCAEEAQITGNLATEAISATVITIAGLCDAIQDDTGLVAAITRASSLPTCGGSSCRRADPFS